MNSDFEKRMQDQRMREIPSQWREEILRATRPQPAIAPWWREWLWPCPQAWAGLAAAWVIILLLHVSAPGEPGTAGNGSSASWQSFAFLQQETEIIAQLSGEEDNRPAPLPPPAATKPRSSRRLKQSVG
jgi:hypothetical protein